MVLATLALSTVLTELLGTATEESTGEPKAGLSQLVSPTSDAETAVVGTGTVEHMSYGV